MDVPPSVILVNSLRRQLSKASSFVGGVQGEHWLLATGGDMGIKSPTPGAPSFSPLHQSVGEIWEGENCSSKKAVWESASSSSFSGYCWTAVGLPPSFISGLILVLDTVNMFVPTSALFILLFVLAITVFSAILSNPVTPLSLLFIKYKQCNSLAFLAWSVLQTVPELHQTLLLVNSSSVYHRLWLQVKPTNSFGYLWGSQELWIVWWCSSYSQAPLISYSSALAGPVFLLVVLSILCLSVFSLAFSYPLDVLSLEE